MNELEINLKNRFLEGKYWISFIAAFIVMYFLSYLFHVVVAAEFIHDTFRAVVAPGQHHENIMGIAIDYLILSASMAWLFPVVQGKVLYKAFLFGLSIGVLAHISAAFSMSATMNISFSNLLLDKSWHVVETIVGSITIGLIRGTAK